MNIKETLSNPVLHDAAATFAAGYARRMMESQYNRLMETEAGRKAMSLSRPKKLAIEAALNGLVAYLLSTKQSQLFDSPVKTFLCEVAMDAPSEISKRLLNGDHARGQASRQPSVIDVDVTAEEQATVLEGLLKMPPTELAAFLTWLQGATDEERRGMAEAMAKLSADEQVKLASLTPEQAKLLLTSLPPEQKPTPPPERGVFGSLADSLRAVNDRLEKRKP